MKPATMKPATVKPATVKPAMPASSVHESRPHRELSGTLTKKGGRHVLTLWGSPEQRGYAHGYLLAKEIHALIAHDFAGFLATRRMTPEIYEKKIVRGLVGAFRWSKDELAELSGMFAGFQARLKPEERRVEFLDRELMLADLKAINTAGDWLNLGCSSIAMRGGHTEDGKPVVVRNFDFFGFRSLLDDQLVLRSLPHKGSPDRRAFVAVTHPGSIGVITALSDARVFVSVHDVPRRAAPLTYFRPNIPRLIALRRLAESLAADDAVASAHASLLEWPTLYGNNFMIATAGRGAFAGVIEYDSDRGLDRGATLRGGDRAGAALASDWLACTNHHRARRVRANSKLDWCKRYRDLDAWFAKRDADSRPLGVPALFDLASLVSMSAKDEVQKRIAVGTLHQAVARLGPGELHLKLGKIGETVASQEALVFSLAELDALRKKVGAEQAEQAEEVGRDKR